MNANTEHLRLLAIGNYPSNNKPAHQVFVRALLREMMSMCVDVTMLAPEPVWNLMKSKTGFRLAPRFEKRDGIAVHRPRYLTYSKIAAPLGGRTRSWSVNAHVRTVLHTGHKLPGKFDLCYGHFLYPQGLASAELGDALDIPAVLSLGESSFTRYENAFDRKDIRRLLGRFAGVIANSSRIKERCIQDYGLPESRIRVFPNGVNEQIFYPRDRQLMRQRFGLPLDRPIVIFVGQLIERKGSLRVLEAIQSRPEIGAIFLGDGPQMPKGPQVLYQGVVPHEQIPLWLSAADIFVLPTLDEGCSNAILEAMFCGLPIVSSDLPFNQDIIDEQVAMLIDPYDTRALGQAIASLVDQPERRAEMSRAALRRSQSFRLNDRASRILAFFKDVVLKS